MKMKRRMVNLIIPIHPLLLMMMSLPMTRLQMKSVSFAPRVMLAREMEGSQSPHPFPVPSAGAMDFCMNPVFPMYPCSTARAITIQTPPFPPIPLLHPLQPFPFFPPLILHPLHPLMAIIHPVVHWLICTCSRIPFRIVIFVKLVVLAMEQALNQGQPWLPLR